MSDKYNEVKVFTLTTEYGVDGVYACRGVACNMVHQWSRRKRRCPQLYQDYLLVLYRDRGARSRREASPDSIVCQ